MPRFQSKYLALMSI